MKAFEELMDRRPFLVNEVLLRRNPNEVVEWEKRIASGRIMTKRSSRRTSKPSTPSIPGKPPDRCTLSMSTLPILRRRRSKDEQGEPRNEPDLEQARKIFDKATKVPFKSVDELAEVWCEWAEMEVRNEWVVVNNLSGYS